MEEKTEIHIVIAGQEHCTWQGSVVRSGETTPFYSELELLHLLERYFPSEFKLPQPGQNKED